MMHAISIQTQCPGLSAKILNAGFHRPLICVRIFFFFFLESLILSRVAVSLKMLSKCHWVESHSPKFHKDEVLSEQIKVLWFSVFLAMSRKLKIAGSDRLRSKKEVTLYSNSPISYNHRGALEQRLQMNREDRLWLHREAQERYSEAHAETS